VSKYTIAEREQVKTIVSLLTIKRIPDPDILQEIQRQTGKSINRKSLWHIRQQIKKESYKWYKQLREGEFEYLYEFRERINEIMDLQRRHHKIIQDNEHNPSIQQMSLAALHKLNATLSNYFDSLPSLSQNDSNQTSNSNKMIMDRLEGCTCKLNSGDTFRHNKCRYCDCEWCPRSVGQDWCPNPQCAHGTAGCKFQPWDPNYIWIKCRCGFWFKTHEILEAHIAAFPHAGLEEAEET